MVTQDLSAMLAPAQRAAVRAALAAAGTQIRALWKAETEPGRKRALERIVSRAQGAAQLEKDFGLSVLDLVRHFGLSDPEVLQPHLASHPHPASDNWPGLLSYYRGAATHEAYFDIRRRNDVFDIVKVIDHLHDVLIRVLLKTIGYDGPYVSPIPPLTIRESPDWVTATTPAGSLGYA
jgi:hypothetical protein